MRELCTDLIDKYGEPEQLDVLIEEMAELTKAILRARRSGDMLSPEMIEEMVDVEISLEQLKLMFEKRSAEVFIDMYDTSYTIKTHMLKRKLGKGKEECKVDKPLFCV